MSIASEITRIQGAKASLKTAIEDKGVEVYSDALIDKYADHVDEIEQAGVGPRGEPGKDGKDGEKGADGLSAYEIWLAEGNTGSEQDFLESLIGDGVVNYVHDQILASEVWEINHNLGYYPLVDVIDSGGTLVIGDVFHVDLNNLILTFSAPFSGKALIK